MTTDEINMFRVFPRNGSDREARLIVLHDGARTLYLAESDNGMHRHTFHSYWEMETTLKKLFVATKLDTEQLTYLDGKEGHW